MSNDKKTLADAQPGGRVRLGDRPKDGEVLVEVSGLTGSGKSAIAGEIEILCKALGLDAEWVNGDEEKRLTHADWIGALEMYKPKVVIVEQNIPRAALSAQHSSGGQGGDSDLLAGLRAAEEYLYYGDANPIHTESVRAAINALAARQPVGEPVDEPSGKGKRKVKAVVSQDDLHKILYLIRDLKNIGNKVWLKHDIHADDYRAATINDAAKVANGAIDLLTRAYSALSGVRAEARVSRSAPGDAWIYADLNELSPHDVAILHDMRDHMAARTMSLNDWHAFGPPVLNRVLALMDNDHAHRDSATPAQAVDLERFRGTVKSQYSMTEWMHRCGFVSAKKLEESKKNHDHLMALIDSQAVGNG